MFLNLVCPSEAYKRSCNAGVGINSSLGHEQILQSCLRHVGELARLAFLSSDTHSIVASLHLREGSSKP